MPSKYDAIIVGAGPAGSMAAYEIAAAGFSVLLLEKHRRPGLPLCCAEGVSRAALEKLIPLQPEWISSEIDKVRVVAPSGDEIELHHAYAGLTLDRTKFDPFLAERAVSAGAILQCDSIGNELQKKGEIFSAIRITRPEGEEKWMDGRIFIAADGIESKIARLAGLNNLILLQQVESLLQYRLENISIDSSTAEFWVGNEIAPKGYIWVFPKSNRSANVGLGIITPGRRSLQARDLLDRFIEKRFGSARISGEFCGMTPKYQGKKMFRLNNLLVAGDASRAIDSLSGAGIVYSLMSGKQAGLAAGEFLSGRISNINNLDSLYPGRFLKEKGEELELYFKLRRVYNHLNDRDFAEIIRALNDYFSHHQAAGVNAGKLLAGIVKTRPSLLRLVRHLI